ncbi:MAG: DUF72 domain-containing protein [Phenylobacterium sp.]
MAGRIRAGMGGWTFEPWRGVFYPEGCRQADELAYASRQVSAIEVNATYHSLQKPESWAKWAAAVPDDFVFTLKGSRFVTNRRVLAEAGAPIERFFGQGFTVLGAKLGPILWQLMPTKRFEPEDFAAFLDLLPRSHQGLPIRHAVEPRHESFAVPAFIELCRDRGVAICCAEHASYPLIPDVTADFVYLRLMRGSDDVPTCYPPEALAGWAERLKAYAEGGAPADLPPVAPDRPLARQARDVFAFLINEGKVNAPAGAVALLDRLGLRPASE